MPTRPCPQCHHTSPRYLPHSSAQSIVLYYRCDPCSVVFTVEKANPQAPYHAVTRDCPPDSGQDGGSVTS